jgi:hypothetical protein
MPDWRLILVDGHHRMCAQVISGKSIQWIVVIHPCESDDDVAKLFCTFNTKERRRSTNTVLGALNVGPKLGIKRELMKSAFVAVPIIACGFDLANRDLLLEKSIDRRVALALDFRREIVAWDLATKDCAWSLKKKLLGSGPLAVALVTFRYHKIKAKEFWGGVAANDGLMKLDPRHTYLRYLNGEFPSSKGSNTEQSLRYAAAAWSAWFNEERPKFFMVNAQIEKGIPVRIAGTNFER